MISLALIAIMLAAVFAGCTGGGTPQAPAATPSQAAPSQPKASSAAPSQTSGPASAEPYKVYFYAWTNPDNMVPLLESFNKDFEGQYEMVYEKLADAATMTINTALASGERIDVMTQASAFDLRVRSNSGIYMGLKQFFDKEGTTYKDVFGDSIEQTQNFDGDYYSMPYCNNINVVYYNKKMFDAAGVAYPSHTWTWEEFRETAKLFTSGEGGNKVYGAMFDFAAPSGDGYWDLIARQKLGAFTYYNNDFTATRFDAPEFKESLQFFYDMIMTDKTVVPLDEMVALKYNSDPTGMNGLYSDRYAMFIAPVYACLYLNASYGDIPEGTDIGMTYLPRPSSITDPITTCYTSTASIPANVENPEASWTAIKYICIDRADLFAGPKAMHPGYALKGDALNAFNKIIFSDHPGLDYDICMDIMAKPLNLVSKDNSIIQGQSKINDLINANMSKVFNGEMGVEDALADLKTQGDQYIA